MIIAGTPSTNIGRGFHIHDNFDINAAETPNILETKEQAPMALVLRFVGYSSPVIR